MNKGKIGNVLKEFDFDKLLALDILDKGNKLLNEGFLIRPSDNKIAPSIRTKAANVPWVYVRPDTSKNCSYWHHVVFETFDLFPVGCLNCWKVVVRPRNIKELFMLHEYQDNIYKGHCKCGIEVREYVHGNYGGYFYNNSLREGLACYKKVRADISHYISPDIPVILKRACTEYELKYGDSSKWEEVLTSGKMINKDNGDIITIPNLDETLLKLEFISMNIDLGEEEVNDAAEGCVMHQPGFVKVSVMISWIKHAYAIGDPVALEFNEGGKPLYTPSVQYQDMNLTDEEIKNNYDYQEVTNGQHQITG